MIAMLELNLHSAGDFDAGWVGCVRAVYRRRRYAHGRSSHWAWLAVSAERL